MNQTMTLSSLKTRKPTLPLFIDSSNKHLCALMGGILALVIYLTFNHFHLFEPRTLPFTFIDDLVPFMPNSVWLYMSEFIFFISVFYVSKSPEPLHRYVYTFFGLLIVSSVIFLVWPTHFPRGMYPLPDDLNAATKFAFSTYRSVDSPASCAPSLHVAMCYAGSFTFLYEQKRKFLFYFLWASAIAFSTMTTKQHYFIDVVLGFIFAVVMYWVFLGLFQYKPIKK